MSQRKRVLIICESHPPSDGGVIRYAAALTDAGHEVAVAGYAISRRSPPASASRFERYVEVEGPGEFAFRRYVVALSLLPGALVRPLAAPGFWALPERRRLWRRIRDLVCEKRWQPDVVVAKHWTALPYALRVAARTGSKVVYDAVEITGEEHAQNAKWRLLARPQAERIELTALPKVAAVLTIGARAAEYFVERHALPQPPTVIRNIPDWPPAPLRETVAPVRFIYVGLADATRGLETLLESVRDWDAGRRLVMHLTGNPAYIASLHGLAASLGVAERIDFRPPVPAAQMQRIIEAGDVGLTAFPDHSRQKALAEPNKFYQYLRGGIPVLSTPLLALSELIGEYAAGWVSDGYAAADLARAVNAIGPGEVNACKRNVRAAASRLSWQEEARKFLQVVDTLSR